jgi:hypothetical protein
VDIDLQLAHLHEGGDGDGLIVDVGAAAAGTGETAAQDDIVFFQGVPQDTLDFTADLGDSRSNRPVMRSSSAPARIRSELPRSPSSSPRAPRRSDLPAPVSPVQAQNPGCSSTRTSSIRARF